MIAARARIAGPCRAAARAARGGPRPRRALTPFQCAPGPGILGAVARRISSPHLVGRAGQLAALEAARDNAAGGIPSISLIAGEPGIGKSRLVAELVQRTDASRFTVLRGDCVQLEEGECPYLPIAAALRGIASAIAADPPGWLAPGAREELARVLPDLVPGGADAAAADAAYSPGRLHELLLGLLRGLSRTRPVLLVVEDLHWADRSTRDLIAYVARNMQDEQLALVVTYRDGHDPRAPLGQLVAELLRRETVTCHRLLALTREESAAVLAGILGEPAAAALADEVFAKSHGNPFYAEELLAARTGDGVGRLPESLREVVLARCGSLSGDALAIVRLAAAAGRPMTPELVDAARVPEPRASEAIREAIAHHVLAADPGSGTIAFRHAIVREVVYDDLLPGERRPLHAALARALDGGEGAHPSELAHHWSAAGELPAALAAAIGAARAAARAYASEEAAEQFASALALWERVEPAARPAGADRIELLAGAAEAARATGDFDRAVGYCRAALDALDPGADPIRAARLHERIGRYRAWDLEGSLACYARALELLPDGPGADRARVLGDEALALMLLVRWGDARERCEQALAAAIPAGAKAEEGYARATLGLVLAHAGELEAGERELERAVALVEVHSDAEDCARAYMHLAEVERLRGRYAAALEHTARGIAVARRLGAHAAFGTFMAVNLAEDMFLLGRWDEAAAQLRELEALPLPATAELYRDTVAGQLAAARGELDAAEALLGRASARRDGGVPAELLPGLGAGLAELALARGEPEEARRHVDEALAAIGDAAERLYTPALYAAGLRAAADLAERPGTRARAAARERARDLAHELRALVETPDAGPAPASARAHAALGEAELTRALGEPDPAAWTVASRAWERLEHPYPAAYARFREAEAHVRSGGARPAAAEALAAARVAAGALGAAPLARDADALARAARLLREDAAAVAPDREHDGLGLTRRELEVLRLVADGLSNRQIASRLYISDNTAGVHVSHILSKLDVPNRAAAAGVAHRAGLLDAPHP